MNATPASHVRHVDDASGTAIGKQTLAGVFAILVGRQDLPVAVHMLIVFGVTLILIVLAMRFAPGRPVLPIAGILLVAFLVALYVTGRDSIPRLRAAEPKLAEFLGIPEDVGRVGIYLPTAEAEHSGLQGEPYSVQSMSCSDVRATVEIVCLLETLNIMRGGSGSGSVFEPSRLFIRDSFVDTFDGDILFLIGGPLANIFVSPLVEQNPYVHFEDLGSELRIICHAVPEETFSMRPPRGGRSIQEAESETTYGCVMKVRSGKRTTFAIWGLDGRGTRGAAKWLADNWRSELYEEFKGEEFTAIIRFRRQLTFAPDPVEQHPDGIPVLIPRAT